MQIADKYTPQQIEAKWYDYWISHRLFHSEPDEREPYTIVIPPPNVTGMLHMGHMLNNTLQDVLIRRARMSGKNACWVPGMDHASIATEAKVVAMLREKGIEKSSLTREEFLRYAWEWKEKYGGVILKQLRKLGASCDWERTCFTMDDARTEGVIRVFCDLYEKGRIYRGVRMVNWDPAAQTALSDEEVVFKESHGKLYYLRYRVEGTDRTIVVATTRPETILGDTALCVNPEDERYQWLPADARVIVPLVGRSIPVIRDTYVDIGFGTGALKVTPAHDVNDYMLGEKYGLETIDIFNDDGTVNDKVGMYVGEDRFEVRRKIEGDLAAAGLLKKTEEYTNNVGYSERTGVAIEPKLSMQWFLSMKELAEPATKAVMEGAIRFVPEKYRNIYRYWMENIKDWCISRQLWWGQRIPAYYLPKGGFVVAPTAEEALEKAMRSLELGHDGGLGPQVVLAHHERHLAREARQEERLLGCRVSPTNNEHLFVSIEHAVTGGAVAHAPSQLFLLAWQQHRPCSSHGQQHRLSLHHIVFYQQHEPTFRGHDLPHQPRALLGSQLKRLAAKAFQHALP